jgi:serine/threonine-protein kinase SRPK3
LQSDLDASLVLGNGVLEDVIDDTQSNTNKTNIN